VEINLENTGVIKVVTIFRVKIGKQLQLCGLAHYHATRKNVHATFSFQILYQNLNNYSLGDVQRFCYYSWYDSTVIFE
jgi:hypothetical protein